jgi:hypothetical protein
MRSGMDTCAHTVAILHDQLWQWNIYGRGLLTAVHSEARHRATPAHPKASLAQGCLAAQAVMPIFLALARPVA